MLLARPAAAARARKSGPAARSNGRARLLARPAACAAASRSASPEPRQVLHRQGEPAERRDHLHRRRRPRSAKVVRSASCRRTISPSARSSAAIVQRARQAQRRGDVVGGAPRLQPVQEPEPLLRERQRQRARALHRHHRRQHRQLRAAHLLHAPRQLRHRGSLEQRPQRQLHAEHLADARDHPRGQQRVPAQLEEVVLPPPPRSSRSTSAQIPASTSSTGVARRHVLAPPPARSSGAGSALRSSLPFGVSGSAPAPRTRRHHVLRQAPAQVLAQRRSACRVADDVRHQPLLARRVLAHRPPAHSRDAACRRSAASISPLDAEAAHLHLVSIAAQELQRRRPPATAPGRPCGTAARPPPPNGSGTKRSAVSPGAAQVAARHARAADVQLARHAHRHRLPSAASST